VLAAMHGDLSMMHGASIQKNDAPLVQML